MSTTTPSYDAVIAGAGPAGSTLATALAGQGWRVLLVERDRLPRHKVCGEFLSPEAQKSLAAHGLHAPIAALAPVPLHGAQLTAHNGRTLDLHLPGTAWGISRYRLDAALAGAAEQRGAEVWYGATMTGWQDANGGMLVRLRRRQEPAISHLETDETATTVQTRALLMACGRNAPASLRPAPATRQRTATHHARAVGIKCHFAHLAMPAQVELYLFDGGYIGINPIEDGYANVCALVSYATFARAGRAPLALIEAAAGWNPAFGKRLRHAQALPETSCAVAPVDSHRPALPWQQLPLVGDSAAMIAPLCGDGMAMALRSAELCSPLVDGYLRAACSWEEMGREYSRLWRREFAQRLRLGRWLETLLLSPTTAPLLFQLGATLPTVADYLVRATRGATHEPVRAG